MEENVPDQRSSEWTSPGCRKKQGQYLCGKCFSGMGWWKDRPDKNPVDLLWPVHTKRGWQFQCVRWCTGKLVARGVPKEEVAFIHEYNTEAKSRPFCEGKSRAGENPWWVPHRNLVPVPTCKTGSLLCITWLSVEAVWSGTAGGTYFLSTGKPEWRKIKIFRYVTENTLMRICGRFWRISRSSSVRSWP